MTGNPRASLSQLWGQRTKGKQAHLEPSIWKQSIQNSSCRVLPVGFFDLPSCCCRAHAAHAFYSSGLSCKVQLTTVFCQTHPCLIPKGKPTTWIPCPVLRMQVSKATTITCPKGFATGSRNREFHIPQGEVVNSVHQQQLENENELDEKPLCIRSILTSSQKFVSSRPCRKPQAFAAACMNLSGIWVRTRRQQPHRGSGPHLATAMEFGGFQSKPRTPGHSKWTTGNSRAQQLGTELLRCNRELFLQN